jgi:hypothetical protein
MVNAAEDSARNAELRIKDFLIYSIPLLICHFPCILGNVGCQGWGLMQFGGK